MHDAIAIKVAGFAASELDIAHEALDADDWHRRLVSQWTGSHVVVFDADHAEALAAIANDWSNDLDRDIAAGVFNRQPAEKRWARAASLGLSGLYCKLLDAAATFRARWPPSPDAAPQHRKVTLPPR